jgi:hypothetical protein
MISGMRREGGSAGAVGYALARFVNTLYAGHELAALYLAGADLDEVWQHALRLRERT